MPFLVRWPGVVKPGSEPDELIQNIDYAATFLEVARLDPEPTIQGRSLMPILKGDARDWRQSLYYAYYEFGEHAVPRHFGVRTSTHKLMFFPDSNEWNMFNLQRDPHELRSIHDDPAYAATRASLEQEFHRLRMQYDAPAF